MCTLKPKEGITYKQFKERLEDALSSFTKLSDTNRLAYSLVFSGTIQGEHLDLILQSAVVIPYPPSAVLILWATQLEDFQPWLETLRDIANIELQVGEEDYVYRE